MLKSLKSWINLPVVIRPYQGRTGTGAKQFGANINTLCYAEGAVKVVTNSEGKEAVSTKQLYVDGASAVSELDNVIFEGRESAINAVSCFYRNGVVDIKVVYL